MTYDPIDTDENDNNADGSVTIDEIDATVLQGLDFDKAQVGKKVRIGEENGESVFTTGPDIPDSVVYQWDAREAFASGDDGNSVSEWTTEVGGLTATGGSPIVRNDGINGYRALEFDGTDDDFNVDFTAIPQPYTVYAVMQRRGTDNDAIFNSLNTSTQVYWLPRNNNWAWFGGNFYNTGSGTGDEQLITAFFDGANAELRGDGETLDTSDIGSDDFDGIFIGAFSATSTHFKGEIGFLEIHDGVPSNGLTAREQEIANNWGVPI